MQTPLAAILRPTKIVDFIGQPQLVGPNGVVSKMLQSGKISSMIFWGPPASGKTTLAKIIANELDYEFHELSAVMDGKEKLKKIIAQASQDVEYGKNTILFIDEIHRWSKSQQDALLPYVESGLIILIGATTENPSFTIIDALLSRSRVFVFNQHSVADILVALGRGLKHLDKQIKINHNELTYIAELANGDMRFALNTLDVLVPLANGKMVTKVLIEQAANKFLKYDKNSDEHYNIISALHKSMRASDPNAAVYWVCRMIDGGEDPLYIARRMVRFASEDIGNASPTSLMLANAVYDTCKNIGYPECGVALVQLAEYLARAPKNNSAYVAYNAAMQDVKKYGNLEVPLHFRNAPTKLMKEIGYGDGYIYDHDVKVKKSGQQAMPDKLVGRRYFK